MTAHLHRKLPFADYAANPAAHFSTLKELDVSPLHYKHAITHPRADSDALRLGRLVHRVVLEYDFPDDLALYDGPVRRGKAWDAFVAENEGKTIMRKSEINDALRMHSAVHAHPIARELLSDGEAEVSMFWQQDGVALKGRIDWLRKDGQIVELKTTGARTFSIRTFEREYAARLYHAQAALYWDGIETIWNRPVRDVLPMCIVVEKEPPHDVAVYRIGYDALEAGQRKVTEWLRTLRECRRTNKWPGVGPEAIDLRLADWALASSDDVDLTSLGGDAA